jgi:pectate lyase
MKKKSIIILVSVIVVVALLLALYFSKIIFAPSHNYSVSANFEDGMAGGIITGEGTKNWEIVDDGSGNKVFRIDNSKSGDWPSIALGDNNFTDGIIEFRVKIDQLNENEFGSGLISMFFRVQQQGGGYVIGLHPESKRIDLNRAESSGWVPIDGANATLSVVRGTWYNIKVVVNGNTITGFINGTQVFSVLDDKYKEGNITMSAGPYTIAEFDDIKIEKMNP